MNHLPWFTCRDWPEVRCCGSCHDDADDYGYDMIDLGGSEAWMAEVCCAVAKQIEVEGGLAYLKERRRARGYLVPR